MPGDPSFDILTLRFAALNDPDLCELVDGAIDDCFGYDAMLRPCVPEIPRAAYAIIDVWRLVHGVACDGLLRWIHFDGPHERVIESYELIGQRLPAHLLRKALEQWREYERAGHPLPTTCSELAHDPKLNLLETEYMHSEIRIQDALASFIRSNYQKPDFLGDRVVQGMISSAS